MTLVLSCVTPDYIVQVSDRQLTWPDGRVEDDDRNKAVFYCGRACVAYCGLAEIDGEDTSLWLGRQMYDVPTLEPALERVAERAATYLDTIGGIDKRMAFVAGAWAAHYGRPPARPALWIVTNFLSDEDQWLDHALPTFRIRAGFLPYGQSHMLAAVGQPLRPDEERLLDREIRRCLKHNAGPNAIARLLAEMTWAIASGSDFRAARVGTGLLIQAVSREAVFAGMPWYVTGITRGVNSFRYFAPDLSSDPFKGAVVACGGKLISNFGGGRQTPCSEARRQTKASKQLDRPGAACFSL